MIREYRVLYFMCSDYKCILNEFTRYDAENEYDSGTAAASRIVSSIWTVFIRRPIGFPMRDSIMKKVIRFSGVYYERAGLPEGIYG